MGSKLVKTTSPKKWKKEVLEEEDPVIVEFFHEKCDCCTQIHQNLETIEKEYNNVKIVKLNIDTQESVQLADFYGIFRVPTLKFFYNGQLFGEFLGYAPKPELKQEISTRLQQREKILDKTSVLDTFSERRLISSEVQGIYYSPKHWERARDRAKQIIQEREELSFSALGEEIQVQKQDGEKIAKSLAESLENIAIQENKVRKVRPSEVEYKGKKVSEEEREALEEIQKELEKVPEIEVKERKTIRLNLMETRTTDLTPITKLQDLRELNIGATNVEDLSPLRNLKELRILHLGATPVKDLSPLEDLENLRELNAWGTKVSNLSPLKSLKELRILNLWNTDVSDLSPLSDLTNLRNLDLRNTPISDIHPLKDLENLKQVNLKNTKVSWDNETVKILIEEKDVDVTLE